jgi:peptidoglycan/xylan/chitin deacetylase (PgdA/CDA1 family)
VIDLASTEEPRQKNSRVQVAITFDDGWKDNGTTAFPIAFGLKVPFTIFVCPELMNTAAPFWPERIVALMRSADCSPEVMQQVCGVLASCGHTDWANALANEDGNRTDDLMEQIKSLSGDERRRLLDSLLSSELLSRSRPNGDVDRTMSWSQLEELHRAGVTFGSHGQRHEILTRIPLPQIELEVRESKEALESRLGDCSLFSYPNGSFSPVVRSVVARFKFKLAFINSPGVWRRSGDPFLVPRVNLSEATVTGIRGRFSKTAFDYRVFWNAFTHR